MVQKIVILVAGAAVAAVTIVVSGVIKAAKTWNTDCCEFSPSQTENDNG